VRSRCWQHSSSLALARRGGGIRNGAISRRHFMRDKGDGLRLKYSALREKVGNAAKYVLSN
jgi:hypothetical protein